MASTIKYPTREQWLVAAGREILDQIILPVAPVTKVTRDTGWAVSCGWPSVRGLSRTRQRTGECWAVSACKDGSTAHIFVSPILDEPIEKDNYGVLPTLVHELVHAVVGTKEGHRGKFATVARAVGLAGKLTGTHAGEELVEKLRALETELGPYPHASLNTNIRAVKKQGTRLIKVIASSCCDYTARVTRTWLDEGLPLCPHGKKMREEN